MFAVIKDRRQAVQVQIRRYLRVRNVWPADAGETVQFNEVLMLGGDSQAGRHLCYSAGVQARSRRPDQRRGKLFTSVKRPPEALLQAHQGPPVKNLTLVKSRRSLVVRADKSDVSGNRYRLRERLCRGCHGRALCAEPKGSTGQMAQARENNQAEKNRLALPRPKKAKLPLQLKVPTI